MYGYTLMNFKQTKKRSFELIKHLKHFAHEYVEKKEQDGVMNITNNHLYHPDNININVSVTYKTLIIVNSMIFFSNDHTTN